MPVLIDVGSLVAAATQMHMDSSHQRQMESAEAPRPTANFDDVFSNGPGPKSQPVNGSGGSGGQKMQTQPMRPNAPATDNHKPQQQQQQQGGLAPLLPDGTVVKQGTMGKITVPAREMHSGVNSPASGVQIDDKKSASAKPAAAAVFSSFSEVDAEASKDEDARHTTRTVIAHQIKTTTVADDNNEDGQGDRELQSHRKKKDDKVIASIKSGNMDRFAGDESAAVSSGRYCSAALAAFVVVAASCL
ncbi:hypothetical protein LPJ57_000292 [Coemansia sp. RSA 486]|nr:hypothetical protein LPJ57_000292 [Coemansia sp. RSA 486]KAJ2238033.1 hypothetical protein IWW45_000373 [Coemansia sp. RSA 485]